MITLTRDYELLANQLKTLRHAKKILDSRIDGLEEEIIFALKNKKRVPYFALEPTSEILKWKTNEDSLVKLFKFYGINILKEPDFITPKQAIKTGAPEDLVLANCEKFNGALKLVEQTATSVKRLFKK